jgi:hypothetical protein
MFQRSVLQRLARLVLAWYVLFLGASVLAATLSPRSMEMVCTSAGMVMWVDGSDDAAPNPKVGMDCPLCAHSAASLPPTSIAQQVHQPDARGHIVQKLPAAVLLSRTAPPLPSRGPPDLS